MQEILCLIFTSRFLWASSLTARPLSFLICRAEITGPSLSGCLRIRQAVTYSRQHMVAIQQMPLPSPAVLSSSVSLSAAATPDMAHMAAIPLHKKPDDGGSFRET